MVVNREKRYWRATRGRGVPEKRWVMYDGCKSVREQMEERLRGMVENRRLFFLGACVKARKWNGGSINVSKKELILKGNMLNHGYYPRKVGQKGKIHIQKKKLLIVFKIKGWGKNLKGGINLSLDMH